MPSTTLSPQARIVALVGVLLIALAGSAYFLLGGHKPATSVLTPPAHHSKPPTTTHHHHVGPKINPLVPGPLRYALVRYPVVVVAFFNPASPVSMLTVTEARAGALTAGVGFLAVNVRDDSVAGPLTALLTAGQILPNPGIAIYGRPGTLLYRADNYVDRAVVVQAVRNSQ